jgi:hypothetical protein
VDNTQCGAECEAEAAISNTGRFVVFVSSDSTLGQGNTSGQAFVHDNCLGVPVTQPPTCIPGPALISRSGSGQPLADGAFPEGVDRTLTVSADGRFATFFALAPELGNDTGNAVLWVVDRQSADFTPILASMDPTGLALSGEGVSMTDDGRYISFVAFAPSTNVSTVYRRDLVSQVTTGVASNATCYGNALSRDGQLVAFVSGANPLNLAGLPAGEYAYVADIPTEAIHLVSVDSRGNPVQVLGGGASLSGDGTHVVFAVLNRADNTEQLAIALTGF